MQKGYKRNNKGIAVVRFFCGLIFIAIIVFAGYCLLDKFDWSDSIKDPSVTVRPYVEVTAAPNATEAPAPAPTETPEPIQMANALTAGTEAPIETAATAAATEAPTPRPSATPIATAEPTPVPTPIATPTPVPTEIPAETFSEYATSGFSVPAAANDAVRAVTKLYISEPNNSQVVQIDAYAYINEEAYDAANVTPFLIVTHKASGKQVVYKTITMEGISKTDHSDALCANPEKSEFESFLDVSWYGNGEFGLGVVLAYTDANGNNVYSYQEFDDSFTVTDGKVSYGETAATGALFSGGEGVEPTDDSAPAEDTADAQPIDDSNSVG